MTVGSLEVTHELIFTIVNGIQISTINPIRFILGKPWKDTRKHTHRHTHTHNQTQQQQQLTRQG